MRVFWRCVCCWLCFTLRYSRFSSCTPERWQHEKPTRPANTTAASYSYNHRRVQKETAGFAVLVVPDLEIGVSTFWPFVHKEQPPERPQRITTHRNCCWTGFIRVVVVVIAVVVPVFVDLIQPRHIVRTPPCCCCSSHAIFPFFPFFYCLEQLPHSFRIKQAHIHIQTRQDEAH